MKTITTALIEQTLSEDIKGADNVIFVTLPNGQRISIDWDNDGVQFIAINDAVIYNS